jgi:hypothetical protein
MPCETLTRWPEGAKAPKPKKVECGRPAVLYAVRRYKGGAYVAQEMCERHMQAAVDDGCIVEKG